jgi:hypothetical protein
MEEQGIKERSMTRGGSESGDRILGSSAPAVLLLLLLNTYSVMGMIGELKCVATKLRPDFIFL